MKKNLYLVLMLCLGLSACNRVNNIESHYESKPQIPMNAHSIVVSYDFDPYSNVSPSDQLFSKTLVRDVEKWAKTRLRLSSPEGIIQISVRKASITDLPRRYNLESLEGNLDIILNILNNNGKMISFVEASVKHKLSAPPNITETEYDTLKKNLIIKLINEIDKEIESTLYTRINDSPCMGRIIK